MEELWISSGNSFPLFINFIRKLGSWTEMCLVAGCLLCLLSETSWRWNSCLSLETAETTGFKSMVRGKKLEVWPKEEQCWDYLDSTACRTTAQSNVRVTGLCLYKPDLVSTACETPSDCGLLQDHSRGLRGADQNVVRLPDKAENEEYRKGQATKYS